ncbi:50S ribosomal protein L22 [Candidatus Daviesbacteria bacterium]|nr:50S ribosomal protein L22 [Candidatus Daviesbacteria bacterium]
MEITTIQKFLHTSPRKLRLVADMVRKMRPARSVDVLRMTPKMAAVDMVKALETVLANVKQKGLDADSLVFRTIEVNESMKMRRFRAGTRGRVRPFKRRMSNIKIVLSDEQSQESRAKSQVKKTETAKEKKGEKS